MNWFRQTLANVAGTQEPEYGPSAIQSVVDQAQDVPYTETTKSDLKWLAMESTCVETQTFYVESDEGVSAWAQIIYNNVGGIRTTIQFNLKIFGHHGEKEHLWCSDPLENYGFDEEQTSFYADNLAVSLNEEGTVYSVKSAVNENGIANLEWTRLSPGFQAGKNGTTYFGTDPQNPWGSMRHVFWPRCKVEGKIITKEKEYDMKGRGLFVHALQGMKPHHAAAKWNFANVQTPKYSAVLMEFTTPASYGTTSVNIGGLAKDGEIICAGPVTSVTHLESNVDSENDWPEPKVVEFKWTGKNKEGKEVVADVTGPLGERLDRIDVLYHVPGVIKTIVGGVVGTKPYIYQYGAKMSLKIKIGDDAPVEDEGALFSESTFIS